MSELRIGSLCSGTGMLDEGVRAVIGGTVAWHCETDPAASRVLAYRYPGVPNHGDLTTVAWARRVRPVDVLVGGFPCQPVSLAGRRAGTADERWIFDDIVRAIGALGPRLRLCVFENVPGLLTANGGDAMARVVQGLASVGFVGRWRTVRASDVGAPHKRERVFVVAEPANATHVGHERVRPSRVGWSGSADDCCGAAADADSNALREQSVSESGRGGTPIVGGPRFDNPVLSCCGHRLAEHDYTGCHGKLWNGTGCSCRAHLAPDTERGGRDGRAHEPQRREVQRAFAARDRADAPANSYGDGQQSVGRVVTERDAHGRGSADVAWGVYEPAIRRWEQVTRPAPSPTEIGPKGGRRLSPRFTEWMQGWPDGWVTDVPGVNRNAALKLCGNGVVPQQAAAGVSSLLSSERAA